MGKPTDNLGREGKVLVVDDEQGIVDFVRLGLQYEGYEVQSANDGKAALIAISEFKPDLVILDIAMPRMNGYEVCEAVQGADMGILILSAKDGLEDRLKGLEVGADDYLVKPFHFEELLARAKAILRRRRPTVGEDLRVGSLVLNDGTRQVRLGDRPIELTTREFDLLKLLMQHPNQVLARDRILDQVWGYNFYGDENNVEVYIRYLRQKLGDDSRQLIQTVRGVGYRIATVA
ncbi:MAG TPA: response regulator transcription factor [Candidatus Dormibacteraeota bacterium]|jgi:DNA-binding response OmpR family regulator|nr:response regulator transcription factor [Candidatus Dormibacteraeota bacterium]